MGDMYDNLVDRFRDVSNDLCDLFSAKNRSHGNSFFRGDLRDLHHSIRRKFHRIEVKLRDGDAKVLPDLYGSVSDLEEDLKDMACFSIMGILMINAMKEV